jgi:hypothetical protein
MSKDKKAAYAEKEKRAAQTKGQGLTPLGETPAVSDAAKKAKNRKQSRGK